MTTMSVSSSYTSSSSTLSSFSKSSFNFETITAAELEPIKLFLQTALQNKQRGQPQGYNVLVQQFRSKDDPEMLGKVVIALNSYISGILARYANVLYHPYHPLKLTIKRVSLLF